MEAPKEIYINNYNGNDTWGSGWHTKPSSDSTVISHKYIRADLALSLAQVVKLDNIIMNMVSEGYNDGYKTRPFYEEVLRRFNEEK